MDAAEYKHVVLGLIFLKYISDSFEEKREKLINQSKNESGMDPEDRDEYTAENIFWVPKPARWANLQANAKQPNIGQLLDEAMDSIEKANPSLKGVLTKDYSRPSPDKQEKATLMVLQQAETIAENWVAA